MRLGHVAISVKSIARSAEFYGRWFGLTKKTVFAKQGMTICLLKGSFTLELFQFKKSKPLPAYRKKLETDLPVLGVKHFSVETADIAVMYRKFRSARARFATDLRTFDNGKRYFFVKDPDGNLVELMEA